MPMKRHQQEAQGEASQQLPQQQHSSLSSFRTAVGQVPGPINILGDVLSRGRDEVQEGLRSVRNNLPQQQQQHVQNLKNFGTKLQQGETKVQEGLRSLGSKIQQNVPVLGGGTDRGDNKQPKVVLQDGIRSIGSKFQQFNISKIVDTSTGTNDFESLNSIVKEHQEFHVLKRQAEEACLQEMKVHLQDFLRTYMQEHDGFHPTYEEWIENIHPENAYEGKLLTDYKEKEIDLRFFLQDSDHRKLWNDTVPKERHVKARNQHTSSTMKNQPSSSSQIPYSDDPESAGATSGSGGPGIVDLLSSSGTFEASGNGCTPTNSLPTNATIDDPFDNLFVSPRTTSAETTTATMTSTAPTTSQSHPIMDDFFGIATTQQVSNTATTVATTISSLTTTGDPIDNLFGYDAIPPPTTAGVGSATAASVGLASMSTTTSIPNGVDNDNKPRNGDADLINFF